MEPESPTRLVVVTRRWYRVLLVAAGLVPLLLILGRWQRASLARLSHLPSYYLFVPALVAITTFMFVGGRRFLAFFGMKRTVFWPSYWLALFLALGTSLLMVARVQVVWDEFAVPAQKEELLVCAGNGFLLLPGALLAIGVCTHLVLLLGAKIKHWFRRSVRPAAAATRPLPIDIEPLRRWIKQDQPISSSSEDLFGHAAISRRIVDRLTSNSSKQAAQAVLGGLGMGKTSLYNLVKENLDDRGKRNVRLVRVSLWPYDEPRAAVEGVVGALVSSLETDVNTIGLRSLPAEYGSAISKAGPAPSVVASLLTRKREPWEVVARIDEIAVSLGLRFVLWVEDLERFASGNPVLGKEDNDEAARLSPIRSLLHALDEKTSFTVISVTTSLLHRFDLQKISRYVERIPQSPTGDIVRIVSMFRDDWMRSGDYLDPQTPAFRRNGWEQTQSHLLASLGLVSITSLTDAVAELCRAPRSLKHVLRRCDEAWPVLRGEVDIDELLAVCALREAAPDAFAIVDAMVPQLRGRKHRHTQDDDPIVVCEKKLDDLELADPQKDALKFIVRLLFDNNQRTQRVQSVARFNHADYWQRIVGQNPIPEKEQDQVVLRTLLDDNVEATLSVLADETQSRAVYELSSVLSVPRAIALLPELARRAKSDSRRGPFNVLDGPTTPGFISLWSVLLKKYERENIDLPLLGAIEESARTTVRRNLNFFIELEIFYASESDQRGPLSNDNLPIAQAMLRRIFVDAYLGKPRELAESLQNTPDQSLQLLLVGQKRMNSGESKLLLTQWPEFKSTVLDALSLAPRAMLPQIASLVTTYVSLYDPTSRFDRTRCETFFGRLATLFAAIPSGVTIDAVRDARTRTLIATAELYRARESLVDVMQQIMDHPEVRPG